MTLTNYLSLIPQQRSQNSLYPKDYRLDRLSTKLTTSVQELEQLKRWPNSKLANIIEREQPLFPDVEDIYYYEFIDVSSVYRTNFTDWRYFYIPLSMSQQLIDLETSDQLFFLPKSYNYNFLEESTSVVYPTEQFLFPFVRPTTTFYVQPISSNTHPYAINFIFTGHLFINKEGLVLYEYQDYKMYSDDITVTYYSKLRPLNFYIPSYIVEDFGFERLGEHKACIGNYPAYQNLYTTDIPEILFSGNSTTSLFTSKLRWYEYIIYNDGLPFNRILLPYTPTASSIDFAKIQLNGQQRVLNLPARFNTQSLLITQTSSNKKIVIEP